MGIMATTFLSLVVTLLGSTALLLGSAKAPMGQGADVGMMASPTHLVSGPLA